MVSVFVSLDGHAGCQLMISDRHTGRAGHSESSIRALSEIQTLALACSKLDSANEGIGLQSEPSRHRILADSRGVQ